MQSAKEIGGFTFYYYYIQTYMYYTTYLLTCITGTDYTYHTYYMCTVNRTCTCTHVIQYTCTVCTVPVYTGMNGALLDFNVHVAEM